jgi:hypothetical protein
LFALTRWTNLYFKASQLVWGDAIGGRLSKDTQCREMFGIGVRDVEVWTDSSKVEKRLTHTSYWKTTCPEKREAPHIVALRKAMDLEDSALIDS